MAMMSILLLDAAALSLAIAIIFLIAAFIVSRFRKYKTTIVLGAVSIFFNVFPALFGVFIVVFTLVTGTAGESVLPYLIMVLAVLLPPALSILLIVLSVKHKWQNLRKRGVL
jgi:hypothetical protein